MPSALRATASLRATFRDWPARCPTTTLPTIAFNGGADLGPVCACTVSAAAASAAVTASSSAATHFGVPAPSLGCPRPSSSRAAARSSSRCISLSASCTGAATRSSALDGDEEVDYHEVAHQHRRDEEEAAARPRALEGGEVDIVPVLAHEDHKHRHHRAAKRVEVLVGYFPRGAAAVGAGEAGSARVGELAVGRLDEAIAEGAGEELHPEEGEDEHAQHQQQREVARLLERVFDGLEDEAESLEGARELEGAHDTEGAQHRQVDRCAGTRDDQRRLDDREQHDGEVEAVEGVGKVLDRPVARQLYDQLRQKEAGEDHVTIAQRTYVA
eukprot:scaffold91150_cov60-Phaeocystis_antarctica.AAC.4